VEASTLRRSLPPSLELPRREAPDVDVELVEPGVVSVALELDLELLLVFGDGQSANGARGTDAVTSPRTRWCDRGQFPFLNGFSSFRTERYFIRHWQTPAEQPDGGTSQMPGGWDASSRLTDHPMVGTLSVAGTASRRTTGKRDGWAVCQLRLTRLYACYS